MKKHLYITVEGHPTYQSNPIAISYSLSRRRGFSSAEAATEYASQNGAREPKALRSVKTLGKSQIIEV